MIHSSLCSTLSVNVCTFILLVFQALHSDYSLVLQPQRNVQFYRPSRQPKSLLSLHLYSLIFWFLRNWMPFCVFKYFCIYQGQFQSYFLWHKLALLRWCYLYKIKTVYIAGLSLMIKLNTMQPVESSCLLSPPTYVMTLFQASNLF